MTGKLQKLVRDGRTGYAVGDMPRDLLIRLVEFPDLPLRMGPAETIKAGSAVLVTRVTLPIGRMTSVAYKRTRRETVLKQVTQCLGPNRTLRSFLAGQRLLALGIATARPLAVIVPSRLNPSAPSWLATEWLEGAQDLAAFAERCRRLPLAERSARASVVAIAVGELLGRMHAIGVSHRDLKPQNVMVRVDPRSQTAEAFLVDLDGLRFGRRISGRVRWKNLSRLAIGEDGWRELDPATSMRFLRAYCAAARLTIGTRSAWRNLAVATANRQARRSA